jgi:hypothetical protein
MAVSTKCTGITLNADGSVSVEWDESTTQDYGSLDHVREIVAGVDAPGADGVTLARHLLLARWLRSDPDGSDTASVLNKTCTVNMGAANPVQIG